MAEDDMLLSSFENSRRASAFFGTMSSIQQEPGSLSKRKTTVIDRRNPNNIKLAQMPSSPIDEDSRE